MSRDRAQRLLSDQPFDHAAPGGDEGVVDRRTLRAIVAEAVVEHTVDAIITLDDRGMIRDVNPAAIGMFGYETEQLVGRRVEVLMPATERHPPADSIGRYLRPGRGASVAGPREFTGRRKGGVLFPLEISVTRIMVGGQRMFTAIICDITQRRDAQEVLSRREQDLRALTLATHDVHVSTDLTTGVTTVVGALESMLGYTTAEINSVSWWRERIHPDDRASVTA